jgi:hypothetical protein
VRIFSNRCQRRLAFILQSTNRPRSRQSDCPHDPWNSERIELLPPEVRNAVIRMCTDHAPRAGHYFATYFENSRLIRLHFELPQCNGRATFCRGDSCLRQEYGLTGGHYRLMKKLLWPRRQLTHAEVDLGLPASNPSNLVENVASAIRRTDNGAGFDCAAAHAATSASAAIEGTGHSSISVGRSRGSPTRAALACSATTSAG